MKTKLTLTIEKSVIETEKKYGRKRDRSLSDLVENYLKALTTGSSASAKNITPIIKSLKGAFKMPINFDYKKELSKRVSEKYL